MSSDSDGRIGVDAVREPLQTVIRNNSAAFGFSIMITGSLAAVAERHGTPHALEILFFGLASIASFSVLDVLATGGFRRNFTSEPPEVVAHAASLSFASVGLGLGSAIGIARLLGGIVVWPVASFVATAIFVLVAGVELAIAEHVAEHDQNSTERD